MFHVKHREVRNTKARSGSSRFGRKAKRCLIAFTAFFLIAVLGWMFLTASAVHLCRAVIHLPDLPVSFSGMRILYLSDSHLHGLNGLHATQTLLDQLRSTQPDVLLLGGNYTDSAACSLGSLFSQLADFPAAMGIYAVAGEDDDPSALQAACEASGIRLLYNSGVSLQRGGSTLYLLGLAPDMRDLNAAASYVRSSQCVIAVANDPECIPHLNTAEAADGGRWVDLCLCGHNLGGQMRIAGRTLLPLSENQRRYLSGWILDSMPILISQGLGNKGLNLRLNTRPEAWLITLEP